MKHLVWGMGWAVLWAAASPVTAADWNAASVQHDLSQGQAATALEATRARLADQPADPEARFLQAMAEARTGDLADAVQTYRQLAQQYPQRARIWNNLGVLYARQGRLDAARDALTRALAAEPGYGEAEENLGDVYVALAGQAYGHAETTDAGNASAHRKHAQLARLVPSLPSAPDAQAASSSAGKDQSHAQSGSSDTAAKTAQNDAADPSRTRAAIDDVLSHWARAWSNRDLSAYLSVYSNDYQPPSGTTRVQWIREQRTRIKNSSSVDVNVSDVRVSAQGDDRVKATFTEHYRAPDDDREATRHMVFVREDGAWRIRRES